MAAISTRSEVAADPLAAEELDGAVVKIELVLKESVVARVVPPAVAVRPCPARVAGAAVEAVGWEESVVTLFTRSEVAQDPCATEEVGAAIVDVELGSEESAVAIGNQSAVAADP